MVIFLFHESTEKHLLIKKKYKKLISPSNDIWSKK